MKIMNTEIYGDISDLLLAKYINFNTGDRFDIIQDKKKSAAKPTKEISGKIRYLRRPVKQLRLQWRWFLGNFKQKNIRKFKLVKKRPVDFGAASKK